MCGILRVVVAFLVGLVVPSLCAGMLYLLLDLREMQRMTRTSREEVEHYIHVADNEKIAPVDRQKSLLRALSMISHAEGMTDDVAERMALGIADRLMTLQREHALAQPDIGDFLSPLSADNRMAELALRCLQAGVVDVQGERASNGELRRVVQLLEQTPLGETAERLSRLLAVAIERGMPPCRLMDSRTDILRIAVRTHDAAWVQALLTHGVSPRDAAHASALRELAAAEGCDRIAELIEKNATPENTQ